MRTRDHYPAEPGVFRRGDGDWGIFDAWNRLRPELWHVHQMYSPIAVAVAEFGDTGDRLDVTLVNRFSHRSFEGLEVRVSGGRVEGAETEWRLAPATRRISSSAAILRQQWFDSRSGIRRAGWSTATSGPAGRQPLAQEAVAARALALALDLSEPGSLHVSGDGRRWLRAWPELHVLDVDMPHVPVPCPRTDGGHVVPVGNDGVRAPIAGWEWQGSISARLEGPMVVFEYACTYLGSRSFNAKEVGLTLRPSPELIDLWWRRIGEWTVYPADHIGRSSGYAAGAPGTNSTLNPAETWERDSTAAGSNDYRSAKRRILAAGATDGLRSLSVLSDGTQHVRAELVDGSPVLHVLDWYGGVRTLDGNHPIWSAYLGTGMPIAAGTTLRGRIVLVAGDRP